LPLLGKAIIGLFTQDGDSPAGVARFFLQHQLSGYQAVVGENLGAADERVTRWPNLEVLQEQRFAGLNYLILSRKRDSRAEDDRLRNRAMVPGVPDSAFAQPADGSVMTRQEVRSILLGKMSGMLQAGD